MYAGVLVVYLTVCRVYVDAIPSVELDQTILCRMVVAIQLYWQMYDTLWCCACYINQWLSYCDDNQVIVLILGFILLDCLLLGTISEYTMNVSTLTIGWLVLFISGLLILSKFIHECSIQYNVFSTYCIWWPDCIASVVYVFHIAGLIFLCGDGHLMADILNGLISEWSINTCNCCTHYNITAI